MFIYNSLTKKKQKFEPIEKNHVRMYVCGPTVYDYCHLGHARCEASFDVIVRYLRFKDFRVTYIRNITDIDDKIINRARKNEQSIDELTELMIQAMHEDYRALGILPPDREPRATEYVEEMQLLIQKLIDGGFAYYADNGDVYFRVRKHKEYGKLSGKNIEELESGVRIEPSEAKEDPLDFVLWKKSKKNEPAWSSPWGKGRPGWHIECSAMCHKNLGDTFDIHGGGPDLKFPHHENEIAQSECANGKEFAKLWMHAGALRLDNEKMSKSLGNFFTIRQILKKYDPETIRYFLISSHYRSQINFSEDSLREAEMRLERFYLCLKDIDLNGPLPKDNTEYESKFRNAMDDDFNTPEALATLFELVREINSLKKVSLTSAQPLAALLKKLGGVLGVIQNNPSSWLQCAHNDIDKKWIESLLEQRKEAKKNRDFVTADEIRKKLEDAGVQLLDSRDGTSWQIKR